MINEEILTNIETLKSRFEGEIFLDEANRILYATDASAYREKPLGVARPKSVSDVRKLIRFANENKIPLIPRAAGTSLAGQVVGNGLVVDVSRHMTAILELNVEEHRVRVQPGVILDELNAFVAKYGIFFGPETSTSSRCMMGGMVGNNSCGAHSILYGSTRDHVIAVKGFLSDGSEVEFSDLTPEEFEGKCSGDTLENRIYRQIRDILSDPVNRKEIQKEFPDPRIHRRNTGYALDLLLDTEPFGDGVQGSMVSQAGGNREQAIGNGEKAIGNREQAIGNREQALGNGEQAIGNRQQAIGNREKAIGNGEKAIGNREQAIGNRQQAIGNRQQAMGNGSFNLSKLVAGSEGTLMFMTEITLNLVPLPPKEKALVCVHCHTVAESLRANLVALKYNPGSVELMDKAIMDCTKDNITQRQNRFFIEGDPGAILIIEFACDTREEIMTIYHRLVEEMKAAGLGYHYPIVFPPDLKKVWDLRKAGLGVLANYPGDRKPVPVIEDTAVHPEALPAYIEEFNTMMKGLGLDCVYYAHIGSGELHLRPVLNLRDPADVELFHTVAFETAKIVKQFNGSLSGEHGDGRLRGEFIPFMLGEHNYQLFREIKNLWDPKHIFNPNKITDTPKMNSSLRFEPGKPVRDIPTVFDFSSSHGILRAAEQCNGSGDCRNTVITGRWMCPSYMALKEENTTTRARANMLREFLTNSDKSNPFDHKEIYKVMDLCLSCKACKSECPSNVDIAKLKAEFLQHYYDANGIPFRSALIAHITAVNRLGSVAPVVFNFFLKNKALSGVAKRLLGFAPKRDIPLLYSTTLRAWAGGYQQVTKGSQNLKAPENFSKANTGSQKEPAPAYPHHEINEAGVVYLFADEFTNFNDVEIGMKAVKLLNLMGYRVIIPDHEESGRTFLSKGLVRKAKKLANANVLKLGKLVTADSPLIGIEPSAILTFRDEYPDLVDPQLKDAALTLSRNALLFDEFICRIRDKKSVDTTAGAAPQPGVATDQFKSPGSDTGSKPADFDTLFTTKARRILLHGHCHQKALASTETTRKMLSIPVNYKVEEIKSGCCGMAGSFGYEKEHYDVSVKVAELVLLPAVRKAGDEVTIAAPGTSCRHQIKDGTGRRALHPIEVLYEAVERN